MLLKATLAERTALSEHAPVHSLIFPLTASFLSTLDPLTQNHAHIITQSGVAIWPRAVCAESESVSSNLTHSPTQTYTDFF